MTANHNFITLVKAIKGHYSYMAKVRVANIDLDLNFVITILKAVGSSQLIAQKQLIILFSNQ